MTFAKTEATKLAPIVQLSDKVRPIVRGDGTMDDLLYDLLVTPTKHGYESRLYPILPFMQGVDETAVKAADGKYDQVHNGKRIRIDIKGNIVVDVGKPKVDFRSIFSCHMDTCHPADASDIGLVLTVGGTNVGIDAPHEDQPDFVYAVRTFTNRDGSTTIGPSLLGADDKLGVFIMCKMIEKGIPGRYIFHVGEEVGCIGSRYIADNRPDFLKNMRRAIAFDRAGYGDVIVSQATGVCASKEFTDALANKLNDAINTPFQKFTGNVRGVYTDTAHYIYDVHECSNISVGYFQQHGTSEHFDLCWLRDILLPGILNVDFENLPVVRTKAEKPKYESYSYKKHSYYGSSYSSYNDDWYSSSYGNKPVEFKEIDGTTPYYRLPDWELSDDVPDGISKDGLARLIEKKGFHTQSIMGQKEFVKDVAEIMLSRKRERSTRNILLRNVIKHGGAPMINYRRKMSVLENFYDVVVAQRALRAVKIRPEFFSESNEINIKTTELYMCLNRYKYQFQTDPYVALEATNVAKLNALIEEFIINAYKYDEGNKYVDGRYRAMCGLYKEFSAEPGWNLLKEIDNGKQE